MASLGQASGYDGASVHGEVTMSEPRVPTEDDLCVPGPLGGSVGWIRHPLDMRRAPLFHILPGNAVVIGNSST